MAQYGRRQAQGPHVVHAAQLGAAGGLLVEPEVAHAAALAAERVRGAAGRAAALLQAPVGVHRCVKQQRQALLAACDLR
jgi:hypothetical protein